MINKIEKRGQQTKKYERFWKLVQFVEKYLVNITPVAETTISNKYPNIAPYFVNNQG